MSTALRRGHSVSAHELENLGKTAARLSETSGISLTEACTRTLEGEGLNQAQVRRAVEHANINAVNSKFASLRGDNRIVHLDHGPADPMTVIDALHATKVAQAAPLQAREYSAAPEFYAEKRAHALPRVPYTELPMLEIRLKAAHDELVDTCAGLEFDVETKLAELHGAAKSASVEGASLSDLAASWATVHPALARVAAQGLSAQIPWGEKRAAMSINPQHRVMRLFDAFAKTAMRLHQTQQAVVNTETELARVAGFLRSRAS